MALCSIISTSIRTKHPQFIRVYHQLLKSAKCHGNVIMEALKIIVLRCMQITVLLSNFAIKHCCCLYKNLVIIVKQPEINKPFFMIVCSNFILGLTACQLAFTHQQVQHTILVGKQLLSFVTRVFNSTHTAQQYPTFFQHPTQGIVGLHCVLYVPGDQVLVTLEIQAKHTHTSSHYMDIPYCFL